MLDLLPLFGLLVQVAVPLGNWRLYRRLRGGLWARGYGGRWTRLETSLLTLQYQAGLRWEEEDYRPAWERARDRLAAGEDRA